MSSAAMKFKERMLKLRIALRDFETKEVFLGDYGEIHDTLLERMNDKRELKGLNRHDYHVAFDKGRGYIRKDTEEFMLMNDAVDWASSTGYDKDRWSGESISLRHMQVGYGGKKYY